MTMKKILAAVAACAMAVSMLSLSVCAAGIEDEGEDLEENDTAVSDTLDDEDEDEDIELDDEDESEDVEADVDDAEDTADVVNPGTGNAPIALAVIPVALAAAAVVAKKASK